MTLKPGDDVWVRIDGIELPGEVITPEHGGHLLCKVHTDPLWHTVSWVMPEQTVAARTSKVRLREDDQ